MKYFITFGAGSQHFIDAGNRLLKQAQDMSVFDKTILYTDVDLKADIEFWPKHSTFLQANKRGYGYWLWKPYIIKKTLALMADGDILLYLDSGCELDLRKKQRMLDTFSIAKRDLLVATLTPNKSNLWTKADLFNAMNIKDESMKNSIQRQAGAIMIYVCKETRDFINEWYTIGCDYHLIDDTPSLVPNVVGFKQHRHDQSIFSLLTMKYNIFSKETLSTVIEYSRNRTGKTQLN